MNLEADAMTVRIPEGIIQSSAKIQVTIANTLFQSESVRVSAWLTHIGIIRIARTRFQLVFAKYPAPLRAAVYLLNDGLGS